MDTGKKITLDEVNKVFSKVPYRSCSNCGWNFGGDCGLHDSKCCKTSCGAFQHKDEMYGKIDNMEEVAELIIKSRVNH